MIKEIRKILHVLLWQPRPPTSSLTAQWPSAFADALDAVVPSSSSADVLDVARLMCTHHV